MNPPENSVAFGAPGIEPRWTSSAKEGVGTAYHTSCRLWFTLSHGIVNEIYYPHVDQPNTRDFQLLITDGETFRHEEKRDLDHRTVEIHAKHPDWRLFRDGCPDGELPEQVGVRAEHVVSRVRAIKGDVLIFSSGHFLRVLAVPWLGLELAAGGFFTLNTASVSVLGYENTLAQPAIRLWNDTHHVDD